MYMSISPHACVVVHAEPRQELQIPRIVIIGNCEVPSGWWESN